MGLTSFIYQQFSGFAQAGKKPVPAQSSADLIFSRIIVFLLFLMAIGVVFASYTFNVRSFTLIRAIITALMIMGLAGSFYKKGISFQWLFRGLLKYWLAVSALLYLLVMVWIIADGYYTREAEISDEWLSVTVGSILFIMGLFPFVIFVYKAKSSKTKLKKAGAYLAAFISLGLLLSGLFGIAYGTGFADWLVDNLLGW